ADARPGGSGVAARSERPECRRGAPRALRHLASRRSAAQRAGRRVRFPARRDLGARGAGCTSHAARGAGGGARGAPRLRESAFRLACQHLERASAGRPMNRVILVLICAAVLGACSRSPEKPAPAQPSVEADSVVAFSPGSPQLAAISLASVEPRREMALRFNGRLVWNEDRTVRLFSALPGRVLSISARVGDRVKYKQTLAA